MAAYWRAVAAHLGAVRRELGLATGVARPRRSTARTLREHRNPVLALAEAYRLADLPWGDRPTLARSLSLIQAEATSRADRLWPRAADAAAFWRAVGVYAGHLRRAIQHTAGSGDQHDLLAA